MNPACRRMLRVALITACAAAAPFLWSDLPAVVARQAEFALVAVVPFVSNRAAPEANPFEAADIYLMDEGDPQNIARVTDNTYYDAFPALSTDGKKIVFDSTGLDGRPPCVPGIPISCPLFSNPDLWVMAGDGTERAFLDHGASGTWSRDGRSVAYQGSLTRLGVSSRPTIPSAGTVDSDILVIRDVDDMLQCLAAIVDPNDAASWIACSEQRVNLTNTEFVIDEDPDWSPTSGQDLIVYTSRPRGAAREAEGEIYVRSANGGAETQLTFNSREERAPAWSPDGLRILYMCKAIAGVFISATFEICVMNADGSGQTRLTINTVPDLTANWSTDGSRIFFHRPDANGFNQLWVLDAAGETQLTSGAVHSLFANPGLLRVKP